MHTYIHTWHTSTQIAVSSAGGVLRRHIQSFAADVLWLWPGGQRRALPLEGIRLRELGSGTQCTLTYIHTYIYTYINTYSTYVPTYMFCIAVDNHIYMHSSTRNTLIMLLLPNIHTYVHTYIHAGCCRKETDGGRRHRGTQEVQVLVQGQSHHQGARFEARSRRTVFQQ